MFLRPLRLNALASSIPKQRPDFPAEGVTARIKARTNLVRDQRWKNDAASGWRFPPFQERPCHFVNRINDCLRLRERVRRAGHPVDPTKRSTGGPCAAKESMQRVDQDRKIGLTCVAWPNEHCQRSQFNRRVDDWPEIAHLKFESIPVGQAAHSSALPFKHSVGRFGAMLGRCPQRFLEPSLSQKSIGLVHVSIDLSFQSTGIVCSTGSAVLLNSQTSHPR